MEQGTGTRMTHRRVSGRTPATHQVIVDALAGHARVLPPGISRRPLDLRASPPLPSLLRFYVYVMTSPPAERQVGAYRIQVTSLADNRRPAHFDYTDGALVILAGYEPDLDVFALWDAGIYDGADGVAWSRNCQVLDTTLYEALSSGVGEQRRHLRGQVEEVVVTATSGRLVDGITRRWARTLERLTLPNGGVQ